MESCYFCKRSYKTIEEQKDAGVVYCPHPNGRIACEPCWSQFIKQVQILSQDKSTQAILRNIIS